MRRSVGAEKRKQKRNESANQDRSRSARQGADVNSTWRRSLSGAAKHCFTSKDPCGSVWRFSEKQNLTHFRMRQQVVTAALFRATGRILNSPPELPLRRPARCWLPSSKVPRPEPVCKRLPARNLQQVVLRLGDVHTLSGPCPLLLPHSRVEGRGCVHGERMAVDATPCYD